MKLLVDESSGKKLSDHLNSEGHDTVYVGSRMAGAEDSDVLAESTEEERVLVTNDKDFGKHVFQKGERSVGVMLLRLQVDTPENRIDVVDRVLELHGDKLPGAFTVVEDERVRFRSI